MKILISKTLSIILGGLMCVQAGASPVYFTVNIDKGQVEIEYSRGMSKEYELTYTIPDDCQAKVDIAEDVGSVTVKYLGEPCQNGAKFRLTLSPERNNEIRLLSGVMKLSGTNGLKTHSHIDARVDAGAISSFASIKTRRTDNYAGAVANFQTDLQTAAYQRFQVAAGVMVLE